MAIQEREDGEALGRRLSWLSAEVQAAQREIDGALAHTPLTPEQVQKVQLVMERQNAATDQMVCLVREHVAPRARG